jgi:hypothetical protein
LLHRAAARLVAGERNATNWPLFEMDGSLEAPLLWFLADFPETRVVEPAITVLLVKKKQNVFATHNPRFI